ncbi:MAG: hypothetical protein WBA28_02670 [Microbacteriaceae bacterium]
MNPDDNILSSTNASDAAESLLSIQQDQQLTKKALKPDARLLYGVWGLAWCIGYFAIFLTVYPSKQPVLPFFIGLIIGTAVLATAIILSSIHATQKVSGSRGPTKTAETIHGFDFAIAFTLMAILGIQFSRLGVPLDAMMIFWVAVPCLIIGLQFLASAVLQDEKSQLIFGSWAFLVGLGTLFTPAPYTLLAGVIGGLGYLALALIETFKPGHTSGPINREQHD